MNVVVHHDRQSGPKPRERTRTAVRLGLLGFGRVGSAVAAVLRDDPDCIGRPAHLLAALVRHASPERKRLGPVVHDASAIFEAGPHVLIEVLGGTEPARTLVVEALRRGVPVVTANKSLLAAHGDELLDVANRCGTPLRYEASVVAGVPFLGTLARRPLAAAVTGITGVLNGTSNFILTCMDDGASSERAVAEAQRLGLAEADPSKDVDGIDAAEKLGVLLQHLAGLKIAASGIPRISLDAVTRADLEHARELGGTIKPVALAKWSGGAIECACGPAFVPMDDPLALLSGVENGVRLRYARGVPLFFSGAGAGPEITARTILDDVREVLDGGGRDHQRRPLPGRIRPLTAGWCVRLRASRLNAADVCELFAAHGVWVRRWGAPDTRSGATELRALTFPCPAPELNAALRAVNAATGCGVQAFPIVDSGDEEH